MIGLTLMQTCYSRNPLFSSFPSGVAFSWAILYLQLSSIPLVMETNHGFTVAESSDVFAGEFAFSSSWSRKLTIDSAISIGAILATLLSIYQEKIAIRFGKMSNTPEGRLYFACIESILMPIGLFWFGWSSFSSVPWIVPTLAVGCATMGIFSVYLAVFNYLADTYHRYASSAIAAQSCCQYTTLDKIYRVLLTLMIRSKSSRRSVPPGD